MTNETYFAASWAAKYAKFQQCQ